MGDQVGAIPQDQARRQAAHALSQVASGPGTALGTELFDQVARHSVSYAFEAVAMQRDETGRLMVYLAKRRDDDTAYPGEYHCPGSVRRPYERLRVVAARLSRVEFKTELTNIRRVGEIPTFEQRGSFLSVVFLVNLKMSTTTPPDKWFPIDELPAPIVSHHRDMVIPLAAAAFELEEALAKVQDARLRLDILKDKFCD